MDIVKLMYQKVEGLEDAGKEGKKTLNRLVTRVDNIEKKVDKSNKDGVKSMALYLNLFP